MIEERVVRQALQTILHPKWKKSLFDIGMIRNFSIDGDAITVVLALKSESSPLRPVLVKEIEKVVGALPEVASVQVEVAMLSREELARIFPKAPLKGVAKVAHFLAVASGKGGVGKTTVAVNVALALAGQGCRVGLLDADVYGPSVPLMLGISEALDQVDGMIIPCEKYGLRIVSMGMTAGQNDAFIWRGPLVSKMLHNLLDQVQWGELDYLVIDLPPGTGDPSIAIANALPQCAILMVTTPQEVALADVRRAIGLFHKTGQAVIGLVENMSYFLAPQSAEPVEIFGHGGGERLSRETGIPLMGKIPIDLALREGGDSGVPLMVSASDSAAAVLFQKIARQIVDVSVVLS